MQDAGLRQPSGSPTPEAILSGAARRAHAGRPSQKKLWNREACSAVLGQQGLQPLSLATRVKQWADLLAALTLGSPSITLTADQMAEELPLELVEPVNEQLQCDGCSYRVRGRRPHRRSGSAAITPA